MEEELRRCIESQRSRGFTYSIDLVEEVYELLLKGKRRRTIARRLGIAQSTVYNIVSAIMQCGGVVMKKKKTIEIEKKITAGTRRENSDKPRNSDKPKMQEPYVQKEELMQKEEPSYVQDNPWLAILQNAKKK